jgi:hypothetical protein
VAILVSVSLLPLGTPAAGARAGETAPATGAGQSTAEAVDDHYLRDAVALAGFVPEPPDTVSEDDFVLPEETDNKKLYRDIAVFVVASAFVAFFIIKVFIEEDEEPADDGSNGKDVPPPR